jgi:hypothetical protein
MRGGGEQRATDDDQKKQCDTFVHCPSPQLMAAMIIAALAGAAKSWN